MTGREKIQAVFERQSVARPPVSLRLDLWHGDALNRGGLPPEAAGLAQEDVEDLLGFARAARFRTPLNLIFQGVESRVVEDGGRRREEYRFPQRTLGRETLRTPEMIRQGLRGHIVGYPHFARSCSLRDCLTAMITVSD